MKAPKISRAKTRKVSVDNLKKLSISDLKKIKRLLPDLWAANSLLPPLTNDPISLLGHEFYYLRLRLLRAKLADGRFPASKVDMDDYNEFFIDREFNDPINEIRFCDNQIQQYIWNRMSGELCEWIADKVRNAEPELELARATLGSLYSQMSASATQVERDLLTWIAQAQELLETRWYPGGSQRSYNDRRINDVIDSLSPLYSIQKMKKITNPRSTVFTKGLLEIELGDDGPTAWGDLLLKIPGGTYAAITGTDPNSDPLDRLCELIDPQVSLSDIYLPDAIKMRIEKLCEHYRKQIENRKPGKLTFLFQGAPGTGKSMSAQAIAHALGLKLLRVNFSEIESKLLPKMVLFVMERARSENSVLLFDECEDLLNGNRFTGAADGWQKILFEEFKGVAVFTTNDRINPAMMRRMSFVAEFPKPDSALRKKILTHAIAQTFEHLQTGLPPAAEVIHDLATQYRIPGGYYEQAVQLAVATSPAGQVCEESFHQAFQYTESLLETGSDDIREPGISLASVELTPSAASEVSRLIRSGSEFLSGGKQSPLSPQGITALFTGPPGTGKTITAEAIAKELGLSFRRTVASSFLSKWVGETENNIKKIFAEATREKHLLFIDEAEGLLLDRQGSNKSWERTQAGEFLQQIESFKGVLIAATNCPDMMDEAFGRRFLFHVQMDVPDEQTRYRLWAKWNVELKLPLKDIELISKEFALSGGEIRNVAFRANMHADRTLVLLRELCTKAGRQRLGRRSNKIGLH